MVTERTPCAAASAAVVSRIASRTASRCAAIVSVHSFGTEISYVTSVSIQADIDYDMVSRNLSGTSALRRRALSEDPRQDATRDESDGALDDLRDPEGNGGMPRWVKVFGLVALLAQYSTPPSSGHCERRPAVGRHGGLGDRSAFA